MLWNIQAIGASIIPHFGAWVGGYRTRNDVWYKSLNKPAFTPPDWVYAPVSTGLYTGMGYASYMVWRDAGQTFGGAATLPLSLYASQLALNWAWPELYFKRQSLKWSLIDIGMLYVSAAACTFTFYRVNETAGHVMLVYLAWLTLAVAINYRLYVDNPQPSLDNSQPRLDNPQPSLDIPQQKPSLDKPQQKPSLDIPQQKPSLDKPQQKPSLDKPQPSLDNLQQKSAEVKTEQKPNPDKTEPKNTLDKVEQKSRVPVPKPRDVIPEPKSPEDDPERNIRKVNSESKPKEDNSVPEPRKVGRELKPEREDSEERRGEEKKEN